jgi:lysyl-tRNA synthetase class 1
MHWFEELLSRILEFKDKGDVVSSAGLSVSGLQHVGRLRGEIIIPNAIANELRAKGRNVTQYVVLYTQDPWKGKDAQVEIFKDSDGSQYANRRLIDVPDPLGCHGNWVDHYWRDFGDYLEHYANDVKPITTTELYARPEMKDIVFDIMGKKDEAREIINRYRGEKKYGEDWIPFEPYCSECKTIGRAKALEVGDEVRYECACGHKGVSPLQRGKLNWRLEWPSLWKLLKVDIEPFGKDHATPGGSRDSCVEIADRILGINAPFGIPYEWVGLSKSGKDLGDMSSSGFKGFTPKDWYEVGEPEALRYFYLRSDPFKRLVLDLGKLDVYHDGFDNAEKSYHKKERDEEEELDSFTWLLTVRSPKDRMFRLAFKHAALLSQILPAEGQVEWAVGRLKDTGMLERDPIPEEEDNLRSRLERAKRWVELYSPGNMIKIADSLGPDFLSQLTEADRRALGALGTALSGIEWREEYIKDAMVALTKGSDPQVDTKRFFKAFYLIFLGKERGPRAAPFLAVLEKDFVVKRLEEAARGA